MIIAGGRSAASRTSPHDAINCPSPAKTTASVAAAGTYAVTCRPPSYSNVSVTSSPALDDIGVGSLTRTGRLLAHETPRRIAPVLLFSPARTPAIASSRFSYGATDPDLPLVGLRPGDGRVLAVRAPWRSELERPSGRERHRRGPTGRSASSVRHLNPAAAQVRRSKRP